jgi:23S rRNA (uracil1939-C5)-methyltransferase
MEIDIPEIQESVSPWRYRRKLTLAMRRTGGDWYAGLRRYDAPDSVFVLRDCLITAEPVMEVWRSVLAATAHYPVAHELRGAVRVDIDGGASFVLEGGEAWPRAGAFFDAVPVLQSLWWIPTDGHRRRMASRDLGAQTPDASFTQVNEATSAALAAHVLARVRAHAPQHVVDAYAGAGKTAVALDVGGVRVTAIEVDHDAAMWAANALSPRSRVVIDRVERVMGEVLPADVVVLNPPRTGVDRRVCEAVVRSNPSPRAMIYVSCDPATLARDVTRLPGWRIASMKCFDMFPQTAHVETVCELVPEAA